MSVTAPQAAAPAEPSQRRARILRPLGEAVAAVGVTLVIYLAFGGHAFLNYDSSYALAWGVDLASGRLPQYALPVAPTPHPLGVVVGFMLAPLGHAAESVFLALMLLGLGALGVGLFRLGERLYAWPVGLLAAAIVLTRQPILNYGIRGYVDLPTIALVIWAAVLEAGRPRRGAAVLALLALAGLLRPEAWLYAVAYWAWMWPARSAAGRARLATLALTAPVLWAVSDLLVTGDPFWSLHGTSTLAAELERPTGLLALPYVVPFRLGEILRLPELVASVIGFAAGLVWLRRRTLLPAAVGLLNGVAFLAFALAGLPLLGRYLFLAAVMLALLTALAALGFTALPRETSPVRTAWIAVGIAVLAAIAVFSPLQYARLSALRADITARDRVQDELRALVRRPVVRRTLASCGGRVFLPNHRNVPSLALWTGRPPGDFVSAQLEAPPARGLFLAPASEAVAHLSILDPKDPRRFEARTPPTYAPIARNGAWILYGDCRQ